MNNETQKTTKDKHKFTLHINKNNKNQTTDKPSAAPKTKRKKRETAKLKTIDWCLLPVSFLLGGAQILNGLYPFGVALAAAAAVKYRPLALPMTMLTALGSLVALGSASLPYIISIVLLTMVIGLSHQDEKKAWLIIPALTLALLCVTKVLWSIGNYGLQPTELVICLFEGFFAAGLAVVMMVSLNLASELHEVSRLSADELVCCFVTLIGALSGLGDLGYNGIAVSDVLGRALVMLAALWSGAGAGAAVGALIGIVPCITLFTSPATVGLYAFAGLLAGAFNNFKKIGTAAGFMLGNLLLSLYFISSEQITDQLIATGIAALVFFLLPHKFISRGSKLFSDVAITTLSEENSRRSLRLAERRLKNTAWLFRELADSYRSANRATEQAESENINMVLNHLCTQVCNKCSVQQVCWTIDIDNTYRGVMELFNVAEKHGHATTKDVPENFRRRCSHLRELVATVNCLYELYSQNTVWQNQKTGSRMFLAGNLEGTAQVLENTAQNMRLTEANETRLEKSLIKNFHRLGIDIGAVQVMEYKDRTLELWAEFPECPGEKSCRRVLEQEVSRVTQKDFRLEDNICSAHPGLGCNFRFRLAGGSQLELGRAQLAKDPDGICGDCSGDFRLEDGKELLMLSDGMGAGVRAALKSGTALNTLSRLLDAGFNRDTAIDTVNTLLMLQSDDESFVTLDICFVDLYRKTAEFIKTGAAPSFIKTSDGVQVIKSNSLPVGMLQKVEKTVSHAALNEGDIIILASDGLLDSASQNDLKWLAGMIEGTAINEPQALAEYLLEKAVAISGGKMQDDITILTAKITAA